MSLIKKETVLRTRMLKMARVKLLGLSLAKTTFLQTSSTQSGNNIELQNKW